MEFDIWARMLLCAALVVGPSASAQETEPPAEDAVEVAEPEEPPVEDPIFEAWGGFSVEDLLLDFNAFRPGLTPVAYNPNTPVAYNVGAAYKHWRIDFKQGLARFDPVDEYGKTRFEDIEIGHTYRKERDLDLYVYYQNYRGFWLEKHATLNPGAPPEDRIRGDIHARYAGSTAVWHSAKRYRTDVGEWMRNPHKLFVVALVVAGSLDYGGFGGTDILVPRSVEFQYGRAGSLFQIDAITLTPSLGYAGHIAVGPAFFSSRFTAGYGLQWKRMDLVPGIRTGVDLVPGGIFDNAFGYDSERIGVSINLVQRQVIMFVDDVSIQVIQLRYGGRARVRF